MLKLVPNPLPFPFCSTLPTGCGCSSTTQSLRSITDESRVESDAAEPEDAGERGAGVRTEMEVGEMGASSGFASRRGGGFRGIDLGAVAGDERASNALILDCRLVAGAMEKMRKM